MNVPQGASDVADKRAFVRCGKSKVCHGEVRLVSLGLVHGAPEDEWSSQHSRTCGVILVRDRVPPGVGEPSTTTNSWPNTQRSQDPAPSLATRADAPATTRSSRPARRLLRDASSRERRLICSEVPDVVLRVVRPDLRPRRGRHRRRHPARHRLRGIPDTWVSRSAGRENANSFPLRAESVRAASVGVAIPTPGC
jgi:hypothetical protein